MAYIGIQKTTESSIKVRLYGLDDEYSQADRICTWYIDGDMRGTSTLGAKVSSGGSFSFTGLSAGTSYYISVSITAPSWSYSVELDTVAETDEQTVEPWYWSRSNGSATAKQTKDAYNAVTNNGMTNKFSYLVWNDLAAKVREVLEANGYSWSNKYATYTKTKMTESDTALTADRFNSLRFNIGSHYSTGINEVVPGDIVYGKYFTKLTDKLNDWIG